MNEWYLHKQVPRQKGKQIGGGNVPPPKEKATTLREVGLRRMYTLVDNVGTTFPEEV